MAIKKGRVWRAASKRTRCGPCAWRTGAPFRTFSRRSSGHQQNRAAMRREGRRAACYACEKTSSTFTESPGSNTDSACCPAELAGFGIFTLGGRQRQHGDRFVARVDDPAFGNACPRVFGTLRLQVARRIVGVDDFDDEISRFRDCSPAWSSCSASTTTRSGSRKRPSRVLTRYSGRSTKPSFAREMWAKNKR